MTPSEIKKLLAAADYGLHLVQNREGKFYRSKGMNGYGRTWVDDPMKAKAYTKVAQARGVVTFFANKWPQFGVPVILRLTIGKVEVLDEVERVEKIVERKNREEKERRQRLAKQKADDKKRRLEAAKRLVAESEGK